MEDFHKEKYADEEKKGAKGGAEGGAEATIGEKKGFRGGSLRCKIW